MRRGSVADEELAPIRIRALISHAHDAARIVAQRRLDLVGEEAVAVDGGGGFGFGLWSISY